jgi:urease accessory protein UreF
MVKRTQLALSDAAEWLGDWHPLAEQLGSADGLVTLASVSRQLSLPPVHNRRSLVGFLRQYQQRILRELELPAIQRAHAHAEKNELRELIAFDQELSQSEALQAFAPASRRIGQAHLQKLRPLRDHRLLRRYLNAVETGLAHGWHILVYGLTLEIYSLPLRQGLLGYAHQSTRSFIYAGARLLELSEQECRELFDELCADLPAAITEMVLAKAPEFSGSPR